LIGEQNQRPKEALIGEAITGYSSHKSSIDWYSLLGYKQVITQVHSYDIFVINTCPLSTLVFALPLVITKISYSYWVITITYPGAWVDQRNCQGGYLVIPQRTGWITSYPPVVISYMMQT